MAEPQHSGLEAVRALHHLMTMVHGSLDLPSTLDAVAQAVTQAAGFEVAALNLVVEDEQMETVAVAGSDEARDLLLGKREAAEAIRSLLDASEPWGRLRFLGHEIGVDGLVHDYWVPDMEMSDDPDAWHPEDTLFAVLTTPEGEWLGTLSVDVPVDGRKPGETTRQILELFADHAAIAIMHARLHAELEESRARFEHLATHDALTGLGNRAMLASYDELRASREDPIGVITVDLDRFKAVNDSFGHHAGDEVLQAVADRMRSCVRPSDVVVRTGGDEFVVLLRGAGTPADLPRIAERLALAIAVPIVTASGTHEVGASIGTAVATEPVDLQTLLHEADTLMYADKRATR